jgi:hypothetical protein
MVRRAAAVAGTAVLLVAAMCALSFSGGSSSRGVSLLELGEDGRDDLRKALALEVSKKRYNKARANLDRLHSTMSQDFEELKKWTEEKNKARAQLAAIIAQYDPSMKIDESATSEYDAPASSLHISTTRHARAQRASQAPEEKHAAGHKRQEARASVHETDSHAGAVRKDHSHAGAVLKDREEMAQMIQQQVDTQKEVSSLAQQMKSMMKSQSVLNEEMTNVLGKEIGGTDGTAANTPVAAALRNKARSGDAGELSFEKSESDSIHKILQRELARLNQDKPVSPGAAMAANVGKARVEARLSAKAARLQADAAVRRDMQLAVAAGNELGATL